MKNGIQYVIVAGILLFCGCLKQHFVPDPDDPNLSKFTFHQFLTGTCYINDTPYINYWSIYKPSYPELRKVISDSTHSIEFSWPLRIRKKDTNLLFGEYNRIAFRIPVQEDFNRKWLMSWEGKQFRGVVLTLKKYDPYRVLEGTGNLYFVKLRPDSRDTTKAYISGLFNGRIGDSIWIKNGRFDYIVETDGI